MAILWHLYHPTGRTAIVAPADIPAFQGRGYSTVRAPTATADAATGAPSCWQSLVVIYDTAGGAHETAGPDATELVATASYTRQHPQLAGCTWGN